MGVERMKGKRERGGGGIHIREVVVGVERMKGKRERGGGDSYQRGGGGG